MLKSSAIKQLQNSKNLLAFSAGVDSTALFFLLQQQRIDFDIAIVDYNKRAQSKEEIAHASSLAKEHNKTLHVESVNLEDKNFEYNARELRYRFFEELIESYGYENLITAHHLGDKLEWFLMRFCKGSGIDSLLGMQEIDERRGYSIVRPLLHVDKSDLLDFLHAYELRYFEDDSNNDESYERNYFRHNFSNKMLEKYKSGILKSFEYLEDERIDELEVLYAKCPSGIEQLSYFVSASTRENIFTIDKELKRRGYLITQKERELLKESINHVIGRKFIVSIHNDFIFIAPYVKTVMDKDFKERCRVLKIEPRLRGYLSLHQELLKLFES